jgi:hypothetical protein
MEEEATLRWTETRRLHRDRAGARTNDSCESLAFEIGHYKQVKTDRLAQLTPLIFNGKARSLVVWILQNELQPGLQSGILTHRSQ